MKTPYLVSVEWLKSNLNDDNLVILDASLKPVTSTEENTGANPLIIPGARKFDLKTTFSDTESKYDHTLPSPENFVKNMKELGVSDDSVIVVYDNQGVYSSPRAWYMIKAMGHKEVYVLDGGINEWIRHKFETTGYGEKVFPEGNFSDRLGKGFFNFCDSGYILKNLDNSEARIIDARSEKRFNGLESEPRPNLISGRIPNSINLPFTEVLENGRFKSTAELKRIFSELIDGQSTLIFSCGSGITSCIIGLAAQISGYSGVCIYDGSWSEWGDGNNSFPIEKTPIV